MTSALQSSWAGFWTQLDVNTRMNPQKKKGLPLGKAFLTNTMAWLRGLDLNQRPAAPESRSFCGTRTKNGSPAFRAQRFSAGERTREMVAGVGFEPTTCGPRVPQFLRVSQ